MSLPIVLNALLNEGRVRVDPLFDRNGQLQVEGIPELNAAAAVLESFELEYRMELAFVPPSLSRPALLWAAQSVQRACSLLTYREFSADQIQTALAIPCPEEPSFAVVYSVDLTMRFLPDLVRLARAASSDDPLNKFLMDWAEQWPLSSVGIGGVTPRGPLTFLDHPCLRQLYIDRILVEQDESRLSDPQTRDAVLAATGLHSQLAPKLAAKLAVK